MIVELRDDRDLEELLQRSETDPVLIFKHSTQCSISEQAHNEFVDFANASADVPCSVIPVIESRGLSDAIAERFGVRHQSPQVLLIKHGQVVWHASHWSITSDSLSEAVRSYAEPANQRN